VKNKLILITIIAIFAIQSANAELTYDNLRTPAGVFYKFGTTDIPEVKMTRQEILKRQEKKKLNALTKTKPQKTSIKQKSKTNADLTIKEMSDEFARELKLDYENMQADLSLLWQGTATKSETIMYAIYKLSNPDKDKPKNEVAKKVISSIAGMSSVAGACIGSPLITSAALIGGNTLGIMSQDSNALNYKYSKVSDTDLIILVKLIDELQQSLVNSYYDYVIAYKKYNMITQIVQNYRDNYDNVQQESQELIIVADTFYRTSLDEQTKARTDFLEKRTKLQQLVGNETFKGFEQQFMAREK